MSRPPAFDELMILLVQVHCSACQGIRNTRTGYASQDKMPSYVKVSLLLGTGNLDTEKVPGP